MNEQAPPVNPGDVLAGKYRVERVLGVGGMGVVVSAMHLDLGQRVALKFLLPKALESPEVAARFMREARAVVKINSEHVARVIDVGRLENDVPYMVMEYLEGHDLSDHPKGKSLSIEDAVDFVLQACEAIAVAHASGIVHRDLKPANLFLTQRPDGSPIVKVLDFGISKVTETDAPKSELTRTSAVMGSPLYMSPEQMRSTRQVDLRTDIWALGVILYELLSGELPFDGETLGEVFAKVITGEPEPLRPRRPELPERLERVISRALEKDPSKRYGNVAEFARALAEFAPRRSRVLVERAAGVLSRAGMESSAELMAPLESNPPPGAATNTSWEDSAAPHTKKASSTPIFVGLFAVAIFAIAAALFVFRRSVPTDDATSAAVAPLAVVTVAPPPAPPPAAPIAEVTPTPATTASVREPVAAVASSTAPSVAVRPDAVAPVKRPAQGPPAPARAAKKAAPPALATAVAPAPAGPTAAPAPAPRKNPLNIDFK